MAREPKREDNNPLVLQDLAQEYSAEGTVPQFGLSKVLCYSNTLPGEYTEYNKSTELTFIFKNRSCRKQQKALKKQFRLCKGIKTLEVTLNRVGTRV